MTTNKQQEAITNCIRRVAKVDDRYLRTLETRYLIELRSLLWDLIVQIGGPHQPAKSAPPTKAEQIQERIKRITVADDRYRVTHAEHHLARLRAEMWDLLYLLQNEDCNA